MNQTNLALEGKSALVTGGRQGIGRAIVDRYVEQGARVMTCGRSARPGDLPSSVLWETVDVSKPDEVGRLAVSCRENLGPLSVLVKIMDISPS